MERRWLACLATMLVVLGVGCGAIGRHPAEQPVKPLRVTEALEVGDPARRASIRLILQGLDADTAGARARAQGSYEQAIKVDPTNPYAYLALARHRIEYRDTDDAMRILDQATALFEAEGMRNQSVGVHLLGLRGLVLRSEGSQSDADLYLDRAAVLAPAVWGDGWLSAEELR